MVFLTISKQVTAAVGPVLLRTGLRVRNALASLTRKQHPHENHSPYVDMMLLIPYAQKLISLAIYDESAQVITKYNRQKTQNGNSLDAMYDSLFGSNNPQEQQQQAKTVSELRMQVLHDRIRPALLPNERWSDVMKWRWNIRVIKWARTEFLVSKYGPDVKEALDAYPQIRSSPQLAKNPTRRMLMNLARGRFETSSSLSNDNKQQQQQRRPRNMVLPSTETLIKAFKMRSWATDKNSQRIRQAMVPNAQKLGGSILEFQGTLLNYAEIPSHANLENLTIEELLEVTGGHVVHCGPFNALCEEANIYQFWTKEYVESLGNYLLDRCRHSNEMGNKKMQDTLILDVGAGDGLLIQYLNEFMTTTVRQRNKSSQTRFHYKMPTLIATDDGSWGIFAKANVEKCSVQEAISKYSANNNDNTAETIVLCSWMPMGQDWSSMFRQANVDEYILIGEADDGTCGHNWETWGNADFYMEGANEDEDDSTTTTSPPPPFYADGYRRRDMEDMSKFQFSRFDCAVSRSSKTVSFRKRRKRSRRRKTKEQD